MQKTRAWWILGLGLMACTRTPLSATKAHPDAAATVPGVDAPVVDAPVVVDTPIATVDVHADVGPPALDAAGNDHASERSGPGDALPIDAPAVDAGSNDAGPPSDGGGCPGNGRAPQASPLFGDPVSYPIPGGAGPGGANATSIGVADVNGDGLADVVVGSYHPALVVYPQMRDGRLGAPVLYPIASDPPQPAGLLDIGDLNGDGHVDVVYPRRDGIGFMPGNAAGGLGPEQLLPSPPEATQESSLVVADLNGDGRSDLVVMPYVSNGVEVRLQDATGTLVRSGFYHCTGSEYFSLAIGDADGDGRPDIALLNQIEICLVRQRSGGGFADGVSLPVRAEWLPSAVGIGKFGAGGCGPGVAFTIEGNQPNSQLGLFSWSPATDGFAGPNYQRAYDIPDSMIVADVDGDGRSDVVVLHVGWQKIGVFRAAPAGGLLAEELYSVPYINFGADRIALGDVNGDGRPDVLSVDFDLTILYHR